MESLKKVQPCQPVAPYIGGKRLLADRIARIISSIPHAVYAEAFVGMGGVFFRRTLRPDIEIINDYSRDVSNLFRILQRHYPQFLDTIKWQLSTRSDFDRLMQTDPDTLTDLERAGRFLYLQKTAYGGKVASRVFGVAPDQPSRFDLTKLVPMLESVHDRLCGVTIERLSYSEFIGRYDDADVLFYMDPPYYGCEGDYGRDLFSRDEFAKMAEQLDGISGRFVLSLNDTPAVRDIFSRFVIRQEQTAYSMATASTKRVLEVLISNTDMVMHQQQETMF